MPSFPSIPSHSQIPDSCFATHDDFVNGENVTSLSDSDSNDSEVFSSSSLEVATPSPSSAFPASLPKRGIVTWNTRSLNFSSHYASRERTDKRRNIRRLTTDFDVCCFQDTKLPRSHTTALDGYVENGCKSFYSNYNSKKAGVATTVSPEVLNTFDIDRALLPEVLQGKALLLHFRHRLNSSVFSVLNVYLSADSHAARHKEIKALLSSVPPSPHLIVTGDFNFVEHVSKDTASGLDHYLLPGTFKRDWLLFKNTHNLREIHQNTHTFFDPGSLNSSRLDRFYTSLSPVDWEATHPVAFPTYVPHSVLTSGPRSPPKPPPSDHIPLGMRHAPPPTDPHKSPSIPLWVTEHPDFLPIFESLWFQRAYRYKEASSFSIVALYKETLFDASARVFSLVKKRKAAYASKLHELCTVVKALRLANLPEDNKLRIKFFRTHPDFDLLSARERANKLLSGAEAQPKQGKGVRHAHNVIKRMKLYFPSTRKRLHALRTTLADTPTSDPNAMAEIAHAYWRVLWSPRSPDEDYIEPASFYGSFRKHIPAALLPVIPCITDILRVIASTGNSCAGPDGIPFAAYRVTAAHAAPVLLLVIKDLAAGILPPEGFNDGLLFLLPKTGTLLPSDTRPISVTNADNRIIAQTIVEAITPAMVSTLHPSQKGFLKDRTFEDHIRELNELFYDSVENRVPSNFHILFMDTAKAFDSIDHGFILEAVARAGLPNWVVSLVQGLLTRCRVTPAFRGASPRWINIHRGVKQGCPLSPILFVICYDILLENIASLGTVSPYACADDLALGTRNFYSLWEPMRLVDRFRHASGLGINKSKTCIISARASSIREYIPTCPWNEVKNPAKAKYLGVIFGKRVSTKEIFAKPLEKLLDRATLLHSSLRRMPHWKRVLAFNVFIVTLFSYLFKFFALPYTPLAADLSDAEGQVRAAAMRLIVKYAGKAYPYPYLTSHLSFVGPGPPIRDTWAWSTAILADQADLTEWHDRTTVPDMAATEVPTMSMSSHAHNAGADLALLVISKRGSFDSTAYDHDDPSKRRGLIYRELAELGWGPIRDADLRHKLQTKWKLGDETLIPALHDNYSSLSLPSLYFARSVTFNILMNAVHTDKRAASIPCSGNSATRSPEVHACYFCGGGQDSVEHIYGSCPVIQRARNLFPALVARIAPTPVKAHSRKSSDQVLQSEPPVVDLTRDSPWVPRSPTFRNIRITPFTPPSLSPEVLGAESFLATSLLAFPSHYPCCSELHRKQAVIAIAIFNATVRTERREHFSPLASPPPLDTAANRLAEMAACDFLVYRRSLSTKSGTNSALGSAGKRTVAQQQAAREHATLLLSRVNKHSIVAFTDGSANPNPGPCGAGAHLYANNGDWSTEAWASLGTGTNNLGELWAVGMALEMTLRRLLSHPGIYKTLYLFTDSAFVIGCLEKGWNTSIAPAVLLAVRSLRGRVRNLVPVSLQWVPAHVGLDENEHADMLAGMGSKSSAEGRLNVNPKDPSSFTPVAHLSDPP